ncbi:Uncharacterised protein [Mycobacterium tuberculosis]|uniref:Uncharacterized protein n=1 Tax=Mycobacterium tuberculosis TaxID=1773 RepID=A0A655DY39_MYCTX|nr:Uncharacterised protein [Mycobacterium tuberculosis]CKR23829.1 Uncharacterised protein [Mycobacterium tuberculosis]CKS45066.1 Uncharacterised protein [Mycobacterium tuberculosis]CNU94090.1 Uncharacterised protein [Mycobacterium tuberculosis]
MIGTGVLSGDHDQVGVLDVTDGHRAFSDSDRVGQRRTRGLVAHVGAVGQVVGAERAHEQLVTERRFVAGAPRCVEHGPVGTVQPVELLGDQLISGIPADGPVVVITGAQDHRVGEPALLGQPIFGLRGQLRHRVPSEELRSDGTLGGLFGDCLGAVLAELGQLASAGLLRPRAAWAVEAVTLIQPSQRRRGAQRAHLLHPPLQRYHHRPHARGLAFARRHRYRLLVIVGEDVARRRRPLPPHRLNVHPRPTDCRTQPIDV